MIPLVVVERSDAPVDGVVRLGPTDAPATAPVLAPVSAVAAAERRAADTWASVAAAEASAAERLDAARAATQGELDARREAYPRRLQFAYQWLGEGKPRHAPYLVEGMWHDGERTYLRTRAASPVLYERVDGELRPVTVATVVGGVVYVVSRVLGPGVLGGRRRAVGVGRWRRAGRGASRWRSGCKSSSRRRGRCRVASSGSSGSDVCADVVILGLVLFHNHDGRDTRRGGTARRQRAEPDGRGAGRAARRLD